MSHEQNDDDDTTPHPRHVGNELTNSGQLRQRLRADVWETHRLYIEHHLFHYVLGGNHIASLHHPRHILDVGCGPGHWGHDMARSHPLADVVGVDAPAPSLLPNPPENYRAVAAPALHQLPFADGTFDYVHMRLQAMKISTNEWLLVLREILRVTTPGGWVELLEMGMPQVGQPFIWKCMAALGRRYGLTIFPGIEVDHWLKQAGAIDVQTREVMLSREQSDGRTGRLLMHDMLQVAERLRDDILALNITTAGSYDMALASLLRKVLHADRTESLPIFVVVGRRPGADPTSVTTLILDVPTIE